MARPRTRCEECGGRGRKRIDCEGGCGCGGCKGWFWSECSSCNGTGKHVNRSDQTESKFDRIIRTNLNRMFPPGSDGFENFPIGPPALDLIGSR